MIRTTLLLATFLPILAQSAETSSAFCRQVPERMDDFAWENDRGAFRMYGPALWENPKYLDRTALTTATYLKNCRRTTACSGMPRIRLLCGVAGRAGMRRG